jgi:hypothetical protein
MDPDNIWPAGSDLTSTISVWTTSAKILVPCLLENVYIISISGKRTTTVILAQDQVGAMYEQGWAISAFLSCATVHNKLCGN